MIDEPYLKTWVGDNEMHAASGAGALCLSVIVEVVNIHDHEDASVSIPWIVVVAFVVMLQFHGVIRELGRCKRFGYHRDDDVFHGRFQIFKVLALGDFASAYDKVSPCSYAIGAPGLTSMRWKRGLLSAHAASPSSMILAKAVWKLGFGMAP